MRLLPFDLAHQFEALLDQKGIGDRDKADYLKWLRFYWDFCHQHHYDAYCAESLPPFLDKLREQRSSNTQRNQARQAIAWFHRLQPSLDATSSNLAPSVNLATVIRNPDAALKSVVLPSNAIAENATTSITRPSILALRDSKRPSKLASYNQ